MIKCREQQLLYLPPFVGDYMMLRPKAFEAKMAAQVIGSSL